MNGTSGLTVTPMAQTLDLKPGDTFSGYITIANPENSSSDFDYKVEVMPYGVSGNDYKADFVTSSARTELSKWVKVSNPTGTLKPNEKKRIDFTATVPSDAPGGGQYAALVFSSNTPLENVESFGINNIYTIASLLYANIDGEIVRDGEVIENTIDGFVFNLPIRTHTMLKNNGNTHEEANIYLEVKNVLSSQLVYPEEGKSGGSTEEIMPETTRYLEKEIGNISPLGIYEVKQTISYLGVDHVTSQIVVACPIWFLFLVVLTVASVVAYIISRFKKRKSVQ